MELIIILCLLMIVNALFDFILIADQIQIDHAKSTFVWSIIYIVFTGLIYLFGCVDEPLLIRCIIFLPFVRWIAHDLILNLLRGKQWDYLGRGEKASVLDRFLAKLPFHFIWLKIGLIGGVLGLTLI